MEIWQDIPLNANYQCSTLGNFKSKARQVRFITRNGKVAYRAKKAKLLKPILNRQRGYYYITLGKGVKSQAHRFIAKTFIDSNIASLDVDHINGNRLDNKLTNLRVVTRKQNINNPNTKVYCLTRPRDSKGKYIKRVH